MSRFVPVLAAFTAAATLGVVGVASAPPAAASTWNYTCYNTIRYDYWSGHTIGVVMYYSVTKSGKNTTIKASWNNNHYDNRSRNVVLAVTSKVNGYPKALLGNKVVVGSTKTGAALNVYVTSTWIDLATGRTFGLSDYCGTY